MPSKLSRLQVLELRELYTSGVTITDLAKRFGISRTAIANNLIGVHKPRPKRSANKTIYPEVESYTKEQMREMLLNFIKRQYDAYNKGRI